MINQLMTIAFVNGDVQVFHKTAMGNLTQLWTTGNKYRANDGKSILNLTAWLNSSKVKEFISVLERDGVKPIQVSGKGNKRKTFASIEVMILAAESLSTEFHVEVIRSFINGKILEYRDESGDQYKAMNILINNKLPDRAGKNNTGIFIQIANLIRKKINPELKNWNNANADELRERLRIEDRISSFLEHGLVRDYEHLKQLITEIK